MYAKILIVEAIATNRIVLKVKLAAAQYYVMQASSVAEAVRQAADTPPDLVICAVALPDGTAVDLVQRLQNTGASSAAPVMAVAPGISATARLDLLDAANIPAMRYNKLEDVLEDPHMKAVDFFAQRTHPDAGTYRSMRHPVRFSETPASVRTEPRRLGEDTETVLQSLGL